MIRTNLFNQTAARKPIASQGRFTLLEYERDLSVTPQKAQLAYFASKIFANVRLSLPSMGKAE